LCHHIISLPISSQNPALTASGGQAEWDFEQPGLVKGVPAYGGGGGVELDDL